MAIDVPKAMTELESMTVGGLLERYAEVFGEPTRSYNKRYLVKRIMWRLSDTLPVENRKRPVHRGERAVIVPGPIEIIR